ncbi:MAG: YciI family protein [Actinomycetota bacterium]|nr:YciI family protein [Actinomycetota bacterium]
MQFLMLVCRDNEPVEAPAGPGGDVEEWVDTMDARGVRVAGDRLAHEREASVVRVRGGRVLVTDGPFLETKEALAGFDLLDCRDLAEAIEVAAAHPAAATAVMEIRPIWVD